MDDNIRPSKRSAAEQQISIDLEEKPNATSDAHKARTGRKSAGRRMTAKMRVQIAYLFFFLCQNMVLLLFVRKRRLWSKLQSIITGVAIFMFICTSMTIGILIVCFTAPKQSGMFF
jgi:predicted RND superfamily exporter protein